MNYKKIGLSLYGTYEPLASAQGLLNNAHY